MLNNNISIQKDFRFKKLYIEKKCYALKAWEKNKETSYVHYTQKLENKII